MKFVIAIVMFTLSTPAFAEAGALVAPDVLSTQTRTLLSAGIREARATNPGAFEAVDHLRSKIAELDQRKRGGMAPVGLMLKPRGVSSFWPLVEHAAFKSPARGDLKDSAWLAWRMGVLEALGMLRDERAMPIFVAVLSDPNAQPQIIQAAARAAGRQSSDEAAELLIRLADDQRFGRNVQMGMGTCRRLSTAQALAGLADREEDEAHARELAKSLGEVANAWAWKTATVQQKAPAEHGAVRQTAAEALVRLYVRFNGPARQAASNALMVVDAPTTPSLIATAAREASTETAAALAELDKRFARNPTR